MSGRNSSFKDEFLPLLVLKISYSLDSFKTYDMQPRKLGLVNQG